MRCLAISVLASVAFVQTDDGQVQTLIRQLQNSDANKAVAAAAALADLGPKAADAAPALVKTLRVKNEDVRLNAALALGKIGVAAVKPLLPALEDKEADIRFYAVWAVGWVGPDAKEAGPKVVALLADKDDNVRRKAAYALGRINPEPTAAVDALIKALADKNLEVQKAAGEALSKFGRDAAPALILALSDKEARIRLEVIRSLGKLGPDAKAAIPELKSILSEQSTLSQEAAQTLGKIGKDALPALSEVLRQENDKVHSAVFQAFRQIGADAVPAAIDALGHPAAAVRRQAAQLLGELNISDKSVVVALAHTLQDDHYTVRIQCLSSLQRLGPAANFVAPKVLALVDHADSPTRLAALNALTMVRGEVDMVLAAMAKAAKASDATTRQLAVRVAGTYGTKAVPLVLAAIKDTDPIVRNEGLQRLATLPGDLKDALPVLRELMKEASPVTRRLAVQALGRAGNDAVPDLIEALKDADYNVKLVAIRGVRQVGPAAKKAIPQLQDLASGGKKNLAIRREAIQTLGVMGADAVDPLIGLLKQEQSLSLKLALVQALGAIGPDAKAALPVLEGLAESPNPPFRNAVQTALDRIKAEKK